MQSALCCPRRQHDLEKLLNEALSGWHFCPLYPGHARVGRLVCVSITKSTGGFLPGFVEAKSGEIGRPVTIPENARELY
jgi:hypothetical protein